MKRKGFTLMEVLLVTVLSTIVVAQLTVSLHLIFRLAREKAGDAELVLKLREIREHLLFQAGAAEEGRTYGGYLSTPDLTWSGNKLLGSVSYVDSSKSIAALDADNGVSTGWYAASIESVEAGDSPDGGQTNSLVYVTVKAKMKDGSREKSLQDRLVIPVFGQLQQPLSGIIDLK